MNIQGPAVSLRVPNDAAGKSIHLVLSATDSGDPPLPRYRRVVLEVEGQEEARILEPLLKPPPEYTRTTNVYRSPLLFNDGTAVRARIDWARRRQEIIRDWTLQMGAWPPVLEKPGLEILSSTPRENFLQQRVRVRIASSQESEGWLLVPAGRDAPMPAV